MSRQRGDSSFKRGDDDGPRGRSSWRGVRGGTDYTSGEIDYVRCSETLRVHWLDGICYRRPSMVSMGACKDFLCWGCPGSTAALVVGTLGYRYVQVVIQSDCAHIRLDKIRALSFQCTRKLHVILPMNLHIYSFCACDYGPFLFCFLPVVDKNICISLGSNRHDDVLLVCVGLHYVCLCRDGRRAFR